MNRPPASPRRALPKPRTSRSNFIYGLPMVMNYAIMTAYSLDPKSPAYTGPLNKIKNESRVYTPKDRAIPLPNSDTPYSVLFMDLRAEPIVLSVPAVEKNRYYSVMLCDGNTFNYGYIGTRTTGNGTGDYLVVGPDWKGETPKGIKKVFHSTYQFSLAAYRTQLLNANDMKNVEKVQAGYQVRPLSAYLNQPAPPAAPAIEWPRITNEMIKTHFFEYLDFVLQFGPPLPEETDIRAKLARIGIGPGKTFAFKDLSAEHKAAILLGMKEGDERSLTLSRNLVLILTAGMWRHLRRPRFLQRRLAQTRGRCHVRNLWKLGRGSALSDRRKGDNRR